MGRYGARLVAFKVPENTFDELISCDLVTKDNLQAFNGGTVAERN